jgi:hypothetical protein
MTKITADSLMPLETYAKARDEFRKRVMAHKKHRTVRLGGHLTLLFEDELTIRYQVQEMLRAERIFEEEGIRGELDAYNPLIPDGTNWKATMMIEYPDVQERRKKLVELANIEHRVWVRVAGFDAVYAIADEDLERGDAGKTSAVHFLRFELSPDMIREVRRGASLSFGVAHPAYRAETVVAEEIRRSLAADLHS